MNENDAFTQLAFHFKEHRESDIREVSQLPNCWEVFPTVQGKLRQVNTEKFVPSPVVAQFWRRDQGQCS